MPRTPPSYDGRVRAADLYAAEVPAEVPALDDFEPADDVEDDEAEDADEAEVDESEVDVDDFDADDAGELLDEEPRLSLR